MPSTYRKAVDFTGVTFLRIVIVALLFVLFYILQGIVREGLPVISWQFLSDIPREGMTKGGIFPAIFGTMAITVLMLVFAMPLGIFTAVYLAEYGGESWVARLIR